MTQQEAKQKAKELVEKFNEIIWHNEEYIDHLGVVSHITVKHPNQAKQCALIAVENEYKARLDEIEKFSDFLPIDIYTQAVIFTKKRKGQVKKEIEAL